MKSILNKVGRILPDKLYLSLLFYHHFHRWMDWKNPKTFNEKLQWLKLHDRKPEYTRMVDKYLVRDYIKEMIGEQYLIPLLGHFEKFDDIDFKQLPNQFVLKCNHGSHCSMICQDKDSFNKDEARQNFDRWLKKNYFWVYREYPYKNVRPCIVCEKFMSNDGGVPEDYKVFCFDGVPQLIRVDLGRFVDCTYNFYTTDWKRSEIKRGACSSEDTECPECLQEMLELSAKLSKGIKHLRVDWYVIQGKLYFGELTFYNAGGFSHFSTYEDDLKCGEFLRLK